MTSIKLILSVLISLVKLSNCVLKCKGIWTNLISYKNSSCPYKHFRANSTCYAYFLIDKSYHDSEILCNNYNNY